MGTVAKVESSSSNSKTKRRSSYRPVEGSKAAIDDPAAVFRDLDQRVSQSLAQESARAAAKGKRSASNLSVKDPNFNDESICQPEPSLLEILEAWKHLLTALQQEVVFTQYIDSLERAYLSAGTSCQQQNNNGRCIHTLLDLLAQAVKEHARDKSIECRFVTLLEVVLSYRASWVPSEEISAVWVRLMQRIPPNIAPVNFRRKAYRVLVSLSWVPSSKGLLEACSFEESKQVLDFKKDEIRRHMARIRDGPLPRYDSVNQLLDRLKDETDVCVAITSEKEGLGKTTLAGQVASHPSILRVFTVLWLNVKPTAMTYDLYITYLNNICQQMGCPDQEWPVDSMKRFEEPALRRLRERGGMQAAKTKMSQLTAGHDRNVLLILDDVRDCDIMEWFRFDDRQSVIVTTPHPNLPGVDWTLELVPMSIAEAIELFLKEAGLPATHILGATVEVRSIVRQCDCNPLTVRTIARWYQLKQVTAGMTAAVEEILADLGSLSATQSQLVYETAISDDPNMLLFDILSLMMGPARVKDADFAPSALFVLCFAAQVVVFPDVAPLDAVLLLWEQVLKMEALAIDELGGAFTAEELTAHAWRMAEGLTHMGVISIVDIDGTPWVQVHHALYKDFAILMAREMNLKDNFQTTAAEWHRAFVFGYFSRKSQGENEKQDASWEYTIEKLPSHMFDGKMVPTAEIVLGEEHFFQARIAAMGWSRGIETQIDDCVLLQHEMEDENEHDGTIETVASHVFRQTAMLLREKRIGLSDMPEGERAHEEARALYLLGFALTENGYFEEALEHFENAEKLSPSSQTLHASILYATGWCLLSANQTERAKTKINASRKMMCQGLQAHGLYKEMLQLYADALVGVCDYQEARAFFEEVVRDMKADPTSNPIELGTTLYKQGRLYHLMGDYDLALNVLDECVNWKMGIGEVSRSLSAALGVLGDINLDLGLLREAKDRYNAALQTLEVLHCDAQHLDYRLLTGKVQLLQNDIPGCQESFELVRSTSNAAPLKVMDQSAYDLRSIALAYDELGGLIDCEAVLRESLLLTEDRPFSLERAWCKIALGNCLLKHGDDKEALTCYEQAREIQMIKLGESTKVIDTTNLIGSVHMCLGDNDDAIRIFQSNYETTMKIAPDDIERLAGVLYLVGDACDAKGAFEAAAAYFHECIDVLKRDRSPDHPDIAKTLQRLGNVNVAQQDLDAAYDYYSEALKIRKMNFDEGLVAETVHGLGVLMRKRGELDVAENYLRDALEIRKRTDAVRESSETLLELGNVYRMRSQPETAMLLYTESLENLADEDALYGKILLTMGHVKLMQGDYAGALSEYEGALLNRVASYGNDDLRTGHAARSMGLAGFLMGSIDDALDHLYEFVRVCDTIGVSASVDIALTQLLLGDIFDVNEDADSAKAAWTRAKDIYSEIERLGENLPFWILPMLYRRLGDASDGKGYLSRVQDCDSIADSEHQQEEIALRTVLFVDD